MRFPFVGLFVAAGISVASAADLTVLSAGAVESAVRKLAKRYEREVGRDVSVAFATGPEIAKRLAAGEAVDVLIAPAGVMAKAAQSGRVVADSQAEVARVGVGVAVRRGAAAPNVGTVDALKEALLAAESVVYNQASTGQYLDQLFDRLGIAEALRARTTRYGSAAEVLEHVARGSSGREIGFGPVTEIKDFEPKGIAFAGPLPAEAQNHTTYIAAVMSDARAPDAGREFVRYLTSAAARRTFLATGAQ